MTIKTEKKKAIPVFLRESLILLGIVLLGILILIFSPGASYPHYMNFQQAIGIYVLFLGYPFYWFIRLVVLLVGFLKKKLRDK